MTELRIQIHHHRSPQLDFASLLLRCERLANETDWVRRFSSEKGFDEHAYVNLTFETDYPRLLWQLLYEQLYHASAFGQFMQAASIAMCEGRRSWDDYLLLHHFDAGVSCDDFPNA